MVSVCSEAACSHNSKASQRRVVNPHCVGRRESRFYLLHIFSSSIFFTAFLCSDYPPAIWHPYGKWHVQQGFLKHQTKSPFTKWKFGFGQNTYLNYLFESPYLSGSCPRKVAYFSINIKVVLKNIYTNKLCVSLCAEIQMGTRGHGATYCVTAPSPGSTVMSFPVRCLWVSAFSKAVNFTVIYTIIYICISIYSNIYIL